MSEKFSFRGSPFINRYRITGSLTTKSPLHIGSGIPRKPEKWEKELIGSDELNQISDVVRDFNNKPYLPGSSLKGVLRMYLLHLFQGFSDEVAAHHDWHDEAWIGTDSDQAANMRKLEDDGSMLEKLFGTAIHAGKIDFWDASLNQKISSDAQCRKKGWSDERQTYFTQSVAIDPTTGAAEAHKLYSFDLVPEGMAFSFDITGQNLSDAELGLLLFGLYAFNSEIYPITLGAMSARGFGRFAMKLGTVYCLENNSNDLKNWARLAMDMQHVGFNCIPKLDTDAQKEKISAFKRAFEQTLASTREGD